MADSNPWNSPWEVRKEPFEVVLLKKDAATHTATPADFRRVPVSAEGTLAAMLDPAVEALRGEYQVLQATKPGELTHAEVMSRQREVLTDQAPIDRARI